MSQKTLILWRHGQTDYNLGMRVQGQVDISLNETGRSQAQLAAAELAKLPISKIVSSPLVRAQDTARQLAQRLGMEIEIDNRLIERDFGAWEGLTGEEIAMGWPNQYTTWRDWGDPDTDSTGVETRQSVGQRVAQALHDYASKMPEDATWVFVSHGSASTQGITALLGLNPSDWNGLHGLDNCHWAMLESIPRNPGWRIRAYNLGAEKTALSFQ